MRTGSGSAHKSIFDSYTVSASKLANIFPICYYCIMSTCSGFSERISEQYINKQPF